MEVILTKDVDKIGKAGTVVKVKDGFARNLLLPKGLAVPVTAGNLKKIEEDKKKLNQELEKRKKEAFIIKERLEDMSLTIAALAQDDKNLYGSITAQDILNLLKEENIDLDKSAVQLDEPIKTLGIYEIPLKLHPEIIVKVKVWIVKK
jgi:large subunit ribosomal protein L9